MDRPLEGKTDEELIQLIAAILSKPDFNPQLWDELDSWEDLEQFRKYMDEFRLIENEFKARGKP
jgi:acyl-CoA hydrolase